MTDFISAFCSRNGISADAFRAEAAKGWAPAAFYLNNAGVNVGADDLRLLTEAVHDVRFSAEPEPVAVELADTPEPAAAETQPEPPQDAPEPPEPTNPARSPWAAVIAEVNAKPPHTWS